MGGRIEITPGACMVGALMLLILPLRWVCGAVLAAVVHEAWHCAAIRLCGGEVYGLKISAGGAVMEVQPQYGWRELICAAAGPVGSFSVLLAAKYLPATALCALMQGLFNLLPIFPLDGGRMLCCILEMLFPSISQGIQRQFGIWAVLVTVMVVICVSFQLGLGFCGLILGALVFVRLFPKKNTLQRTPTGGTIEIH